MLANLCDRILHKILHNQRRTCQRHGTLSTFKDKKGACDRR
ncbi:MAG: hypothetical protein ACTS2F_02345 [Thainema sp.]